MAEFEENWNNISLILRGHEGCAEKKSKGGPKGDSDKQKFFSNLGEKWIWTSVVLGILVIEFWV